VRDRELPSRLKVQLFRFVVQLVPADDDLLSLAPGHPPFAMFKGILPGTSKRISNSEFMMVTPLLDAELLDPAAGGGDKENIEVYAPRMVPPKLAPASRVHKRTFSQAAPKEDTNVAFEQLLVSIQSSFPLIRPRL
jgi:hypothetical protein